MVYLTKGLEETYELAKRFVESKLPRNCKAKSGALVVGLCGELGAGKTSFVQGVARAFGIKGHVTSPTFVLEKIYPIKKNNFSNGASQLVHIDVYRLSGAKEMAALGWDEISANSQNIVFIEWPERVAEALPKDMIKIYFESVGADENKRRIKIVC